MENIIIKSKIVYYWIRIKLKYLWLKFWKSKFKYKVYIILIIIVLFKDFRQWLFQLIIKILLLFN